jgi:ATP-dependent Clp protease protease subunit
MSDTELHEGQEVYVTFTAPITPDDVGDFFDLVADFVRTKVGALHLIMSTPGGNISYGIAVHEMLRAVPMKVFTWNIGAIESISVAVFLAGSERYCSKHALFGFHNATTIYTADTVAELTSLYQRTANLDADQARSAAIMAGRCKLSVEQIRQLFNEGVSKDATFALQNGLVTDIRELKIPFGATLYQFPIRRS